MKKVQKGKITKRERKKNKIKGIKTTAAKQLKNRRREKGK